MICREAHLGPGDIDQLSTGSPHIHEADGRLRHVAEPEIRTALASDFARYALADVTHRGIAPLVIEDLTEADRDALVAGFDLERIPPFVIRLRELAQRAGALADRLEARWNAETGGLGWKDPGSDGVWSFRGMSKRDWTDIPGLVAELMEEGIALRTIAEAISEIRVTALRDAAARAPNYRRERILELIEEHRRRAHGIPHFVKLEE
jgi:hypothetical protein